MLIADDADPDGACVCTCFSYEENGLGEPVLPLVNTLEKTPPYAPPPTLEETIMDQLMDAYGKQACATVQILVCTITIDWSRILVRESGVDNAIQNVVQ